MGQISKLALQGHEVLVDIGCEDGKITAQLAAQPDHGLMVGIDSSQEMIDLAKASYPTGQHPNLKFIRMDASSIDLLKTFNIAFSNATLHRLKEHQAVLLGVHGSQRPGDRLLFQMGGRGDAQEMMEVVDSIIRLPVW